MRNGLPIAVTVLILLLASSCASLAYLALAASVEPAAGTFPESSQYSKLDGWIYYNSWDSTGKLHQVKISDADPEKFQVVLLGNGVIAGEDGTHIYLKGEELFGVDRKTFEAISLRVRDLVGDTRESNELVFRDFQYVYRERNDRFEVVDGADPRTFERINDYWSKDQSGYFLFFRRVNFGDRETFHALDGPWARDRNGVYLMKDLIPMIDPTTFIPIPGSIMYGLGKDKDHVFWAGKVIPDADPDSFRLVGKETAVDKKYFFTFFPFMKRILTLEESEKYKQ